MTPRCSSIKAAVVLALALAAPSLAQDWQRIAQEGGITVWRREIPGSPLVAFKGEGEVASSMARVASVLRDSARKGEWMDHLAEARVLREMGPGERVEYNRTAAPWPLRDRDFVFHAKADWDPRLGRITIAMRSVEDPSMPADPRFVRGNLVSSTMTLTRLPGGAGTLVSLEVLADPQGHIPPWIVNFFQSHWPRKTLQGLRAQVAKPDVGDDPYVLALPGQ